jgi:hypothetical protein
VEKSLGVRVPSLAFELGNQRSTSNSQHITALQSQHSIHLVFEVLPSYRTHRRELRQSNPEIRRSLGFLSPVPSLCVASNGPNRSQKRRKMLVLRAELQYVGKRFQNDDCRWRHCKINSSISYAFIFHVFVVDPARVCHNCASARFCDVTEDVFIVPSSESEWRERVLTPRAF